MDVELTLGGISPMEIDSNLQTNEKGISMQMEQELSGMPNVDDTSNSLEETSGMDNTTESTVSSVNSSAETVGSRKRKQTFVNLASGDMTFTSTSIPNPKRDESDCLNGVDDIQHPLDLVKSISELTKLEIDVLDKPIKNISPAKARKISILSSTVSKLTIKDASEINIPVSSTSTSDQTSISNLKEYASEYIHPRRFLKPLFLKPPDTPIDRPRQMIRFLEGKRKHVHFDSLYHWVLWNENLKRAHAKRNDRDDVQIECRENTSSEKIHAMEREEKIRRDCSRGYLPLC